MVGFVTVVDPITTTSNFARSASVHMIACVTIYCYIFIYEYYGPCVYLVYKYNHVLYKVYLHMHLHIQIEKETKRLNPQL